MTALVGKIGIRICSGSVCKIHERASQILKEPYDEIRKYTLQQSHLNADESSWKIAGRDGFDKQIGERLLECKTRLFDLWHQFKEGHLLRPELIKKIEAGVKEDVKLLLKAGAVYQDCLNKTKATCMDFLNRFDTLWLFVYVDGVEPTNNLAERGLRHGVIWRKISYGSQSETGERFVERVMTVAMTLKLRAKNTFEYFTECFREFIRGGQSPPIFSY